MWSIWPSHICRVSHAAAVCKAHGTPISMQLLQHQLMLYGRIARERDGNPFRAIAFCPGSMQPAPRGVLRRVDSLLPPLAPKWLRIVIVSSIAPTNLRNQNRKSFHGPFAITVFLLKIVEFWVVENCTGRFCNYSESQFHRGIFQKMHFPFFSLYRVHGNAFFDFDNFQTTFSP